MFPSVLKRKNAFDEDDGAVFSGQPTTPLTPVNALSEKKIVIKVCILFGHIDVVSDEACFR